MIKPLCWIFTYIKSLTALSTLLVIFVTATVWAFPRFGWYSRNYIDRQITGVLTNFRTEWRCSEWSEDLTALLVTYATLDPDSEQALLINEQVMMTRQWMTASNCAAYST